MSHDDRQTERLMLHYGERGPVELEVWHEDTSEATHVISEWPKSQGSRDVTDDLRRAGYKLVAIEDE